MAATRSASEHFTIFGYRAATRSGGRTPRSVAAQALWHRCWRPVGSTTDRACHKSWSVCTTYPRSAGRTDVTVVFARTGAAVSLA